nr:CU044_2847 family protein [Nostoc sp. CHAB 5715]
MLKSLIYRTAKTPRAPRIRRVCVSPNTVYSLNAFKKIPIANIDKVTLEFGIKVGGEAGIPYVTKGTAESNLKVTVECSFPDQLEKQTQQS